uniref:Uncharacterized protein n=1 Tax=Arundo donax TaxID=35708 RepID=A0A0A9F5V0_ARUDO
MSLTLLHLLTNFSMDAPEGTLRCSPFPGTTLLVPAELLLPDLGVCSFFWLSNMFILSFTLSRLEIPPTAGWGDTSVSVSCLSTACWMVGLGCSSVTSSDATCNKPWLLLSLWI